MKSTLSTNDGAATEELNEEKPKPLEPSLVHDEIFQPMENTRLSGVKVRWSQGRQFLKLNTDGAFNFTKNATRHQFDGKFGERRELIIILKSVCSPQGHAQFPILRNKLVGKFRVIFEEKTNHRFTRPGGTIRIHTSAYLEHVPSVPREPESTRNQNARLQKVHSSF